MRRQSPDTDRARCCPSTSSIARFRLKSLILVLWIVIAYVDNDAAICRLHGMQFMILCRRVAGTGGNGGEPAPGFSIVGRFANSNVLAGLPELLPGIK